MRKPGKLRVKQVWGQLTNPPDHILVQSSQHIWWVGVSTTQRVFWKWVMVMLGMGEGDGDAGHGVGWRQVFWKCRKCDVAAASRCRESPNIILLFNIPQCVDNDWNNDDANAKAWLYENILPGDAVIMLTDGQRMMMMMVMQCGWTLEACSCHYCKL